MKNKKYLKAGLVLALGVSFLLPANNISYASSTTTDITIVASELEAAKDKYQKTYNVVLTKYTELKKVTESVLYINASKESTKYEYSLYLNNLVKTLNDYNSDKVKEYKKPSEYELAIMKLNEALKYAEEKKAALDGKVVDDKELFDLHYKDSEFKESYYKKATKAQKEAYDKALSKAREVLVKGKDVSAKEYNDALKALKDARNDIINSSDKEKVLEDLKKEITEAEKLDKSLYTEKSYNVFKKALLAAKTTAESANSTLDQCKTSLEALQEAKKSLVKVDTKEEKELAKLIEELKTAKRINEQRVSAAQWLLDNTPETVKKVKGKLEKLIKDSKAIIKEVDTYLAEYEKTRG